MPRLPVCTPTDVIRALNCAGFFLDHSTGSHRFFRHPVRAGIVTVPFHRKDLKRGTLKSILEQAGISTDEFIKLI
ncbi:MAG TPA: type II toxin-antitoxin system HicA family toxin [Candidatus Binataceae bacterium]|nr:type II toxin-antitoxin system HicA family toxin [Candidatus Binataceae bacterium]